ncbi:MAG: ABC transporter ATP-binding protein [Dongiaceae bacterium]
MQPQDALVLQDLEHAYERVRAVDGVSLSVKAGEVVCLVGPSGCGKSTVLRLAAGLETLQNGRVSMHGEVVGDPAARIRVPPEQRHVGLVFQDFALFPHLTVGGNVAFGLSRLPPARREARACEVLRQVEMESHLEAYPHSLSGGQQQRVALARALAPEPSVLLLDEPFSGLDERLREQVRDDTLRLLRRNGTAALLVTHDPEEALFMADRIYLMRAGRIAQSGPPQELYYRPVNLFAASFFSRVNEIRGVVREGHVESPVGRLCAPGQSEGAHVVVTFRPEAVSLSHARGERDGGLNVEVRDTHFLGTGWVVHVLVKDAEGREVKLSVRLNGRPPRAGERVALQVPADAILMFPET